jgi:hypothetical protein
MSEIEFKTDGLVDLGHRYYDWNFERPSNLHCSVYPLALPKSHESLVFLKEMHHSSELLWGQKRNPNVASMQHLL